MNKFFISLAAVCCTFLAVGQGIVPQPVSQTSREGRFAIRSGTVISVDESYGDLARYLNSYLQPAVGSSLEITAQIPERNSIRLQVSEDKGLPAEGYELEINQTGVTVTGADRTGLHYGIETLLQMLPAEIYAREGTIETLELPCGTIWDYPRFAYRGFMLDVARTFTDKEGVLQVLDRMAHHKLNKLHWHLTDDDAWRIEIKSHPELIDRGAFRGGDYPIRPRYGAWNQVYGGYYTQDDIREIVDYATARDIEIIPEIDLPGHSLAIASVFPEVLCRSADSLRSAGFTPNVLCVAREENYALLDDIMHELSELFPSSYIHVGGDEVDPSQWNACPDCQALMVRHGFDSPNQVNGYFMQRMQKILRKYGKHQAVWSEAVDGDNLPLDTRVHGWKNVADCRKTLGKGYSTVIMPATYFYFDMQQSPGEPGLTWAAIFDMEKTYSFDFDGAGITSEEQKYIAGIECALWMEVGRTNGPGYLDYQIFPRICAFSEVAWSPREARQWENFYGRMNATHYNRLVAMGAGFRITPPVLTYANGAITAMTPLVGAEIRYTSDGTEPQADSPLYTGPIATDKIDSYWFTVFYKGRKSPSVPVPGANPYLTPKFTLTSSMPLERRTGGGDFDARNYDRTSRTCQVGDYVTYTFDSPVSCGRMSICTGYPFMPKFYIPVGKVEISYDGTTFEPAGDLVDGRITLEPSRPFRAIRIVSESDGNCDSAVYLRDPIMTVK